MKDRPLYLYVRDSSQYYEIVIVCVSGKQFACTQPPPPTGILYENCFVHVHNRAAIVTVNIVCIKFITMTLGIFAVSTFYHHIPHMPSTLRDHNFSFRFAYKSNLTLWTIL